MDNEPRTTILVVEDETLVRMLSMDILEDAGFEVLEAGNADEALSILKQHEVQLLFSDIDMPGSMDGVELAELVHERWPNIQLLLTSGHRQLEDSTVPDGGQFVGKPWNADTLIGKIRSVLNS